MFPCSTWLHLIWEDNSRNCRLCRTVYLKLQPWRSHSNIDVTEECGDLDKPPLRPGDIQASAPDGDSSARRRNLALKHFSYFSKFSLHRLSLHCEFISTCEFKKKKKTNMFSAEQIAERVSRRVQMMNKYICLWFLKQEEKKNKSNKYCTRYMLEKNTGSCFSA